VPTVRAVALRRWEELTTLDLEALPGDVGLVPVGATQHHGHHLPIGTDSIVARAVCAAASARCGAPVLPAIDVGCGIGATAGGTLSLAPDQLTALARRLVAEAAASGLRRLLFVNAHPGNAAALADAVDPGGEIGLEARVGVAHWWALDAAVAAECAADPGVHGGRAETAVMLAVAPELVRLDRLPRSDPRCGATEALGADLLARTAEAVVGEVEGERAAFHGTGIATTLR